MSSHPLLASPSKSISSTKSSSHDIVRIANQSVDEFLNTINKSTFSDDYFPTSPITKPLNLLDDLDDFELHGPKPYDLISPLKPTMKLSNNNDSTNNGGTKSPKKVTIDDSPSKIHNYHVSISSNDSFNDHNNTAMKKLPKINPYEIKPLKNHPLPSITKSSSNKSVKSLPADINYYSSDRDELSDDSDLTLSGSPIRQNKKIDSLRNIHHDDADDVELDQPDTVIDRIAKEPLNKINLTSDSESDILSKRLNTLSNPKLRSPTKNNQHKRSSSSISISSLVSGIIRSFSNKNIADEKEEQKAEVDDHVGASNQNVIVSHNNVSNSTLNARISSVGTNESCFYSALEFEPENENDNNNDNDNDQTNIKEQLMNIDNDLSVSDVSDITQINEENAGGDADLTIGDVTINEPSSNDESESISEPVQTNDEPLETAGVPIDVIDESSELDDEPIEANQSETVSITSKSIDEPSEIKQLLETSESKSPNESFESGDFVLHVPFEDDIFDQEFDQFNKSLNNPSSRSSSDTSTSTSTSSVTRNISQRDEILNIWSKQKLFNSISTTEHNVEFDSIKTPIKNQLVVNQSHIKSIHVLDELPIHKRISSDEFVPSSWMFKKNPDIHILEILTDNTQDNSVIHNTTNKNEYELNLTLNSNDSMDNSFLKEIKNIKLDGNEDDLDNEDKNEFLDTDQTFKSIWNDMKKPISLHSKNDSIEVLKQVWDDDAQSRSQSLIRQSLTHSDTFERFNNKNIENYINKKRLASDESNEFKFIRANDNYNKIQFNEIRDLIPEQKARICKYDSNMESVPDLGISQGMLHIEEGENDVDGNYSYNDNTRFHYDFEEEPSIERVDSLAFIQIPIRTPISPAREKMVAKFEQQLKQKEVSESHKILQNNLKSKIHQEASLIQKPIDEVKPKAIVKPKRHDKVFSEDVNDIYENFENSPTKIPTVIPGYKESPIQQNDPFNSPIKNNIFKTNNSDVEINDNLINPFDAQSANFERISSNISKKKPSIGKKKTCDEMGRLFLRIKDLNNIKLPDFAKFNSKIQLIIDNGIHCIKTEFIKVNKLGNLDISINKEFELIASDNLNIIITLRIQYDKPGAKYLETSERKEIKSTSMIKKLRGKKEYEIIKKKILQAPEDELLSSYIASDGSFGKIKINFDDYKRQIFGKPSSYSLTCFNEWKNTKIKSGVVENRSSIPICTLNLKMMFIPRKNSHEILPISIANAINQLKEARKLRDFKFQGFMSQEGGDLRIWTKRFYKLENFDLFAYNLTNNKLKAKINLKKVVDVSVKDNYDDELNHGFKIKFSNNELITFDCDSISERNQWVDILQELIATKQFRKQPWLNTMMEAMKDIPV